MSPAWRATELAVITSSDAGLVVGTESFLEAGCAVVAQGLAPAVTSVKGRLAAIADDVFSADLAVVEFGASSAEVGSFVERRFPGRERSCKSAESGGDGQCEEPHFQSKGAIERSDGRRRAR